MTSALQRQQSMLLQALAGQAGSQAGSGYNPRGLQVYQSNRAVLAGRTLASTYPVIYQLIGVENFEPMARHFWQQHPPQRGDMGQWGAQLPGFLKALAQLADEPFLADVASVEWAMHRAASAQDAVLDTASFGLLSNADEAHAVSLALCPGVLVLGSAYPVVSIIHAHLTGLPTLDEAGAMLRSGQGEHALIWRQGFKPKVRLITAAEYQLMTALENGLSLDAALGQALGIQSDFDFNAWLAHAVQTGLVTGALLRPLCTSANGFLDPLPDNHS